MNRAKTCTCTEQQLDLVGCDCVATMEAVRVRVWPKGYASDPQVSMVIDGGYTQAEREQIVREAHGSFARIFDSRPVFSMPQPKQNFSAEYIRQMSMGG